MKQGKNAKITIFIIFCLTIIQLTPKLYGSEQNYLKNSGFEEVNAQTGKLNHWGNSSIKTVESSSVAYSGEKSLKVNMPSKPKWGPKFVRGIFCQSIKSLDAGAYVFSAMIKGDNIMIVKICVTALDEQGKQKYFKKYVKSGASRTFDWKSFMVKFSIPEGFKSKAFTIEFLGERGKKSIAYIDDVKLIKKTGTDNVMFNSGFEICSSPGCPDRWISSAAKLLDQKHYNSELVTGTAFSGKNSLKISYHGLYDQNTAYFSGVMSGQCSDVEEGKEYTVSLYMKTDNPPAKINLWMNYVNRKTFTVDSKEWKRYSFTSVWRKTARKTRSAFILLFPAGRKGEKVDANIWVDDIMAESGTTPTAYKKSFMDKLWLDSGKKHKRGKKAVVSNKYPHLKCFKGAMNVKVDGKLNESFWEKSQFANCKLPYSKVPVSSQTAFSIVRGKDAFYIGIKARHKAGRKRKVAKKNNAFVGDWVEFFLDPNAKDNSYYQFAINENGELFTARSIFDPLAFEVPGASGYLLDYSWYPKLDYAVETIADGWNAEIRIPMELFRKELVQKAPFRLNVYRVNTYTGEANCWSKPSKNFHSIPDYGYLDNVNIKFSKPEIEISPIVFTPSGDAKGVIGRFSINKTKVKKIKAEIFMKTGEPTELIIKKTGRICQLIIPFPEKLAKNKTVRIKMWRDDSIKADIQKFSKVKIISLLSFGVNSLVFRSEKAFQCLATVRLPQEYLNDCSLKVDVSNCDTGKIVLTKNLKVTARKRIYKIQFKNLADGFYNFKAKLFSKGKQLAVRKVWTYLGKKKKYFVRTNVNNSYVEKHGKPFFITGAWIGAVGSANLNPTNYKRIKDAGFNAIAFSPVTYRIPFEKMNHEKIFEEAKKNNFYIVIDFGQLMWQGTKRHKYSREKILEIIKTMVLRYRNHPNLLFYHGMDEWWAGRSQGRPFCSDADIKKIYWLVRKLDPYHAFFFNLGPRPQAWYDLRFTDIFSYDCYVRAVSPIEFNLDRYMYYLKHGQKYANEENKPLFNVLQFDEGSEVMQSRLLRFVEQRCLTYITLLYGSKGIQYFTGLSWCESKNKELRKINLEIEKLTPILLSYEKAGKIVTINKNLEAKWFKYKGEYYIIAVNLKNEKVFNATLSIKSVLPESYSAKSVFGSLNAKVNKGNLKISFEPYGVRVFKITP